MAAELNGSEGLRSSPLLIPFPGQLSSGQEAALLKVQQRIVGHGLFAFNAPANVFLSSLRNGQGDLERAIRANEKFLEATAVITGRPLTHEDIFSADLAFSEMGFVNSVRRRASVKGGSAVKLPADVVERWTRGVAVYDLARKHDAADSAYVREGIKHVVTQLLDPKATSEMGEVVEQIKQLVVDGVSHDNPQVVNEYNQTLRMLINQFVNGTKAFSAE